MHLTAEELENGLHHIRHAPRDAGVVKLIVRRPRTEERESLEQGQLDEVEGLVGDRWLASAGQPPNTETQITVMNARVAQLVAQDPARWALAGDQLYIDLDLSMENLPAGTRLAIGEAVIEISARPHTGCKKFTARFGPHAVPFVNSPLGKQLRLRGLNARVVQPGTIRVGDVARKLPT
jgi:MOSC domain-containing protein YiiM